MSAPCCGSPYSFPEPGSRWSLLEMINFSFGSVRSLLTELGVVVAGSHKNMQVTAGTHHALVDEDYKRGIADAAKSAKLLFADIASPHIDAAVRSIERWVSHRPDKMEWSEMNTLSRRLRDAIEIELKQHLFFRYDKEKGLAYLNYERHWHTTLQAFPDTRPEIIAASDCYALGHSTASVFHSMRIAEYGLRALAKERRIKLKNGKPIEWATWMDIIKELDKEIVNIGGKTAGPKKDNALSFYSGARVDLNGFKDEYRNSVMHVRFIYDEHQAIRALTNVRSFMERVSAKITSKHARIRWGF